MSVAAVVAAELARWDDEPELADYAERRTQARVAAFVARSPEWRRLQRRAAAAGGGDVHRRADAPQADGDEAEGGDGDEGGKGDDSRSTGGTGEGSVDARAEQPVAAAAAAAAATPAQPPVQRSPRAARRPHPSKPRRRPAAGPPPQEYAASDLQSLSLKELRTRAGAAGVGADAIELARDSDEPKRELIALLTAATAAGAPSASASPPPQEYAASDLQSLSLKELRTRAGAAGVGADAIELARDSDEPKRELIALLTAATAAGAPSASASPPPQQLDHANVRRMVRSELELAGLNSSVSDRWIDALFDEFDEDGSGLIGPDEWERIATALPRLSAANTALRS